MHTVETIPLAFFVKYYCAEALRIRRLTVVPPSLQYPSATAITTTTTTATATAVATTSTPTLLYHDIKVRFGIATQIATVIILYLFADKIMYYPE